MTYVQWYEKNILKPSASEEDKVLVRAVNQEKITAFANGLGITEEELERVLCKDREHAILTRPRYCDPSDW